MPIGAHWRSISVWEHVLIRMEQKLASWKKKQLNKAGRLILIKSCLASLPIYYLSFFHLPVSMEKRMIKIMRNFLWGTVEGRKKLVWVSWKKLCVPNVNGGLGVKNLRRINQSLLVKWIWRFSKSKTSLWGKLVNEKFAHNSELLIPDVDNKSRGRSLWKNVTNMVTMVQNMAIFTVRNGKGIRFWKDRWLDRGKLQDVFPVIYEAVKAKDATIYDMITNGVWICDFKRPLNLNEQLEWDLLRHDLNHIPDLVEADDGMGIMENFNASRCYERLSGNLEECGFDKFLWKGNIPNKVSFIIWDTFHDSLPTRDMLQHRGVNIDSEQCVLCNDVRESENHMFIHCKYSFEIWKYFIKSFRIAWPFPRTLLQLFEAWSNNVLQGRGKDVWQTLHYAVCWILWKQRNGRFFGGRHKSVQENIDLVKKLVVLWSCDNDTFKYVDPSLIWSNWDTLMCM